MFNKIQRGQVSVEFVLIFSLISIFATLFIGMIFYNMTEARSKNEVELLEDLANSVQQEVVLASSVEPGYQRNFTLPPNLGSKAYDVSFYNYYIIANTSKSSVVRGIPLVTDPSHILLRKMPGHMNFINKNESGIFLRSN